MAEKPLRLLVVSIFNLGIDDLGINDVWLLFSFGSLDLFLELSNGASNTLADPCQSGPTKQQERDYQDDNPLPASQHSNTFPIDPACGGNQINSRSLADSGPGTDLGHQLPKFTGPISQHGNLAEQVAGFVCQPDSVGDDHDKTKEANANEYQDPDHTKKSTPLWNSMPHTARAQLLLLQLPPARERPSQSAQHRVQAAGSGKAPSASTPQEAQFSSPPPVR